MKKIKVLIVDDSALVRELFTRIINEESDMEVVGTAMDPYYAVKMIKKYRPDVITLDVEMPRMNGLDFLKRIMSSHPMPVIMISSWTEANSQATIKALDLGAIDFIPKPKRSLKENLYSLKNDLIQKIRAASVSNVRNAYRNTGDNINDKLKNHTDTGRNLGLIKTTAKMIVIGASTGGTTAIRNIVTKAPADATAMVVVQHMPEKFTASFADSLDKLSAVKVKEAENGEQIIRGYVYIAPGNKHTLVYKSGAFYHLKITGGERVNNHMPSVDKTFFSVADNVGQNATGIILTGMGNDGAQGIKAMHEKGSFTVAQDEKSSVIFGMPKEAIATGHIDKVMHIDQIAEFVKEFKS